MPIGGAPLVFPFDLCIAHRAHELCRASKCQHPIRNDESRGQERCCADDRVLTDDRAVHHDCAHSDESTAADTTTMKNCAVTDMTVALNDAILARKAVHDAVVLHVGAVFDDDAPQVAAQRGAGTDVATGADNDVSDQDRGWMHEASLPDNRSDRIIAEATHWQLPCSQ